MGGLGACVLTFCTGPARALLLTLLCWELSVHPCLSLLLAVPGLLADEHRLPPQPQSADSLTSLCRRCLLAFLQPLPGWSQIWGSASLWWLQEVRGSRHDREDRF